MSPRLDTRNVSSGGKAGFVIAILVNVALWVVINVRPGWSSFDFLAPTFSEVLPIVNASLIVGALINAAYLVVGQQWFRHLSQCVALGIGAVVAWRLLVVFPFELATGWDMVVRSILILALLGSGVGALVEFVRLLRGLTR